MAEPEIPCEVPSCGKKRELNDSSYEESEDAIINDSDDSEESEDSIGYDSDDPAFEILEGKADRKIWKQYYREWDESEGFDISVHPGTSFMAGLVPIDHWLKDPVTKQTYTNLCNMAIDDFNSKNDKVYVFQEIVKVNATFAAGVWLYFTFKARDTAADADTGTDTDAIKTFQALVWHGIDKTSEVSFCRFKKSLSNEDKKKKKKKKKSQQDSKAVTEVEQDKKSELQEVEKNAGTKPSLVRSFVPGLVIEELAKGKPGGKKAYPGFKVGVRYTGKLKENDKIFATNIGEEEPLEFRIASGQLIKGWEIGVDGMRVGDRRRITIPPALGYGAKGDGGVVPPDSWLVLEVELIYIN